jgi:hypothetical protein
MAWQGEAGCGRRSLVETAAGRYKAIIGPELRARMMPAQQGEAGMAVAVLNRMIRVAKLVSVRVARYRERAGPVLSARLYPCANAGGQQTFSRAAQRSPPICRR